ncbi:hypothetical protein Kpho02_73680 [Kitasatospora phosalacinea]|uniref:Transposase IS204/IS1001/IS1096/IS1165 DDE domain-containing protein n=1 Tax=Kitasatospora phosalacinea TaxID=2065 RepID=A0A9W6QGA0_9ACTN|nr:transposase [Kitasatospora phosalacinea]GLW75071.1 hypothetical protein Kpho02_73680 [Kitasatospora phosalacinea]
MCLEVRRFVCVNSSCGRRTFVEQIVGLTRRHGRWTEQLRSTPASVGLALAGRAGARLASVFGTYGTVLVDAETRRPVDLLPDRAASSLAAWLAKRPRVEVVCRDRAPFFAEDATVGAPQAVQVADRWHLWHNLSEAAERSAAQHRRCLQALTPETPIEPEAVTILVEETASSPWPTGHRFADRVRNRHATVHALLEAGHSRRSIPRQLGMTYGTVKRLADATHPEELFTGQ